MKTLATVLAAAVLSLGLVLAEEPDGLVLPPGFHASVVADALGPVRHLAVRKNGDIYVSTAQDNKNSGSGIIALRLDRNHKAGEVQHFGTVHGGTGIRFYNDALYAASQSAVYRFTFSGNALVPAKDPEMIVGGMPGLPPGFNRVNRPLAFDGKGSLFVGLEASANLCADPKTPEGAPPVGLRPCPDLGVRAGVWRFSASKVGQTFAADGEQVATGIRDMSSLAWSAADESLYGIMHGRDSSNKFWPSLISAEDDDRIADEMHRITKGTNFGWPYTYYDGVRGVRLVSPDYGGNGKTLAPAGTYATPVQTFHSRRSAPVDLVFYDGTAFPAAYRGGAFVVLHGTANRTGYNVVFVPFNRNGRAGSPTVFVDGFAAFDRSSPTPVARYRPMGAAVGPDGALYVTDSVKGRIWRIAYGTNP